MIDWLLNGDRNRSFISTPHGRLSYGDLIAALPDPSPYRITAMSPALDIESIISIFSGMTNGAVVLDFERQWTGDSPGEDLLTVMFTSGTSGQPKVVPLTRANWRAAVEASAAHLDHGPEDEWLVALPLHHVGGLAAIFRSAFVGAGVRLLPQFDERSFAEALGEVTMASVVPTMLRRILDLDGRRYRGLRAVLVGGGPIPVGLLEEAAERGLPVLPTYGMTETCAQVATLRPGAELAYRVDPLPGVEVSFDSDGRIALRGDQIFSGYAGEEKRAPEEWFVTGDIGSPDPAGGFVVHGRADSIIVTGGENVDPAAVEGHISAHPGVVAAMVVGEPSDEWGSEVVCLYVGDVSVARLDEWVRARGALQRFEVPKRWIHVAAIPTTALGKPDRGMGRTIAEAEHDS